MPVTEYSARLMTVTEYSALLMTVPDGIPMAILQNKVTRVIQNPPERQKKDKILIEDTS